MSDTPRTDNEIADIRNVALEFECRNSSENAYVVGADFARQLERELNEAKTEVAFLKSKECEAAWCDRWKRLCDERDQWRKVAEQQHRLLCIWTAKRSVFESWQANKLQSVTVRQLIEWFGDILILTNKAIAAFDKLKGEPQ